MSHFSPSQSRNDRSAAGGQVVVLGDSHVGKTSLVTRFAEGYYRDSSREPTVGAHFVTRRIQSSDGTPTKVQIWDTAGQESFHQMASMFYKNAAAIVFCYDVTSRASFDGMRRWLDGARSSTSPSGGGGRSDGIVLAIAGLKSDLRTDDSVPEAEASALAEAVGAVHVPTSAKADFGVDELFRGVADLVLRNSRVVDGGGIATPSGGVRGETQQHPPPPARIDAYDGTNPPPPPEGARKSRRDKYDRYHSKSDGNRRSNSSAVGGSGTDSNQNRDGAARTSSQGSASTSGTRRRSGNGGDAKGQHPARSSTPSTLAASDGGEAFLEHDDGQHRGSGACGAGDAYACHPTASCGAMDGGTGCAVQ